MEEQAKINIYLETIQEPVRPVEPILSLDSESLDNLVKTEDLLFLVMSVLMFVLFVATIVFNKKIIKILIIFKEVNYELSKTT